MKKKVKRHVNLLRLLVIILALFLWKSNAYAQNEIKTGSYEAFMFLDADGKLESLGRMMYPTDFNFSEDGKYFISRHIVDGEISTTKYKVVELKRNTKTTFSMIADNKSNLYLIVITPNYIQIYGAGVHTIHNIIK